jgi:hypothetical protein
MPVPRVETFDCGRHELTYRSTRAGCPLCDAERQLKSMRESLTSVVNENTMLKEENARLKTRADLIESFREATHLLDDEDTSFLKTVLYQWRDRKSISLRLLYEFRDRPTGRRRRESVKTPVGFLVVPRQGDAWAHTFSSIGGMSIAANYEEATQAFGPTDGMKYLMRGMSDLLPGSIR